MAPRIFRFVCSLIGHQYAFCFTRVLHALSTHSAAARAVSEAAKLRKSAIIDADNAQVSASTQRQLHRLAACVQTECEDEYRVYALLQKYLIDSTLLQHDCMMVQLSKEMLFRMTERYYRFDEAVMRCLLGKKLSSRDRTDPFDECEERIGVRLSSCQRQFDNIKRVRGAVIDDENSDGGESLSSAALASSSASSSASLSSQSSSQQPRGKGLVERIRAQFGLSAALALSYARVVFLCRYRFDTIKRLSSCSYADFERFASIVMTHWASPTSIDGDELHASFIQEVCQSRV